MHHVDPLILWAGVAVTLAVIALIGFVVTMLRSAPLGRLAAVLTALAAVLGALPAILSALHG